ncbi:MAG: response regulator transcription factor, partial [Pseudomonadales bacterium]|nr:response regulator transcription factor [Pseudomonadales bacterium]
IRAILRRAVPMVTLQSVEPPLKVADIELLTASRKVYCRNREIGLTGTEFNLLKALLTHAGEVISKKQLTEMILERKLTQFDRSIDMHVSNIRRKLGPYHSGDARIQSVRGVGYIFVLPPEESHPE